MVSPRVDRVTACVSVSDLARQLGISRAYLYKLRDAPSAPPFDAGPDAWKAFLASRQVQPGTSGRKIAPSADGQAYDYYAERARRTKVEADRAQIKLRIEERNAVPAEEISNVMTKIAAVTRVKLARLEGELPPLLEGIQAADMQAIIAEKIAAVLDELSLPENFLMPESK
jgi:hypothetical protein